MRTLRQAVPFPALILGLALIVAACGGAAAPAAPATQAPAAAATAAAAAATAAPAASQDSGYGSKPVASMAAAGAVTVNLGNATPGKVLVDGKGMTLYVFTADSGGASACYDACAAKWPPLAASAAPTLGPGLDAEDFTTAARTDGTSQLSFYGMPLYFFAGDKAPGDVNGQGLGGKWFVVTADGKPVK